MEEQKMKAPSGGQKSHGFAILEKIYKKNGIEIGTLFQMTSIFILFFFFSTNHLKIWFKIIPNIYVPITYF